MAYLRKAVKLDKDFAPAYLNLATMYTRIPIKAKKYYKAALRINPESPEVLMELRRLSFSENRRREDVVRDEMLELCRKYYMEHKNK